VRATDAATLLENSGTLQASGDLVLGNAGQIVDLNNSGTLLTGASLQIEGGHLSNTGRVQATDATTIRAVSLTTMRLPQHGCSRPRAGRRAASTSVKG
jgi:adhesin HecA-like repeat protein